ncbi:MAG: hypothetical protein KDE47_12120, partial [Caldilineaceae bacterium]|nr:hypothetical protein [Caldilineaceae bacterium]
MARTKQVWADTIEFDYLVAPALQSMPLTTENIAHLQRALELYRGDFLAGFFLRDAHQYDEWVSFERERYLICAVRTAQIVANHYLATNNYAQGLGVAQRWVQLDPLNEIAHQTLMELLVSSGQRTAALEHYQRHLHKTASEGIELTGEFEAFYQRLSRDELATTIEALQVCVAPAVAPIAAVPHNLPASLTPLVGRQDELFQIQHRLEDPTCRLLTITGMGGAGKTRLALEVGQLISRSLSGVNLFRDGVYLVRLEQIAPEQSLLSVIASAMGYVFQGPHEQAKQFLHYLRNRQLLLILDNFEHLLAADDGGSLDAVDLVVDLLEAAPKVQILITSRQRLNLRSEQIYSVPAVPVAANATLDEARASAAVCLFVQVVQSVQADFQLTTENLAAVLRICQAVQGMPLGLELAAANVHGAPLTAIADALEQSAEILTVNWHDLPARQRSMRAVFAWSWRLLTSDEQH